MAMEIKVDLSPDDINKTIVEAVAKSAIGEKLTEFVKKQVANLSNSYDNPIERVVRDEIHELVRKIVGDEFKPRIEEFVRKAITEQFVNDIMGKLWQAWVDKSTRY
jgi:hypothetical protein